MARIDFDPGGGPPPADDFEPVPAGWYEAQIVESSLDRTKAGDPMLKLKWSILGPTHGGRVVFQRLLMRHPNEEAVRIAKEALHRMTHAMGLGRVGDSQEMHGRRVQIKLTVKARDGYEPQNEVVGYKAIGNGAPAAPSWGAPPPAREYRPPPTTTAVKEDDIPFSLAWFAPLAGGLLAAGHVLGGLVA